MRKPMKRLIKTGDTVRLIGNTKPSDFYAPLGSVGTVTDGQANAIDRLISVKWFVPLPLGREIIVVFPRELEVVDVG